MGKNQYILQNHVLKPENMEIKEMFT